MQFKAHIGKFSGDLWGHHLIVPTEVAEQFVDGNNRRVILQIQNGKPFQCALMHKGDGSFFINLNKEIRKKLGLAAGMEVEATLQKDESRYGIPMPEEMLAAMEIDPEGTDFFHALTLGKQRSLLYVIGKPKSTDIRIRKALIVLEHLREQRGKLDYKILNQDFKDKKH